MPRFDTSFNFGAAAAPRASKPAAKPRPSRKRLRGGKGKSPKFFAAMHGS